MDFDFFNNSSAVGLKQIKQNKTDENDTISDTKGISPDFQE
jgi:hypothetical protein